MEGEFKKVLEEKPDLHSTSPESRAQVFADYAKRVINLNPTNVWGIQEFVIWTHVKGLEFDDLYQHPLIGPILDEASSIEWLEVGGEEYMRGWKKLIELVTGLPEKIEYVKPNWQVMEGKKVDNLNN